MGANKMDLSRFAEVAAANVAPEHREALKASVLDFEAWIKEKTRYEPTPAEAVVIHYPWDVAAQFAAAEPNQRMLDHARLLGHGDEGLTGEVKKRLSAWYLRLRDDNLVIEYNPHFPPEPGVSDTGGWAYRHREEQDADLLIRKNGWTRLTEEGQTIWALPDEDLWP
ncbi:XRE family transcriptional regulator [Nocardia sp. NPDC051570]|uniref:XRE family transcriptional regulator n=1 Tax=Nocardia sp. NPDC051570 TaxID=3364324 RepID=UPI00378BAA00